MTYESARNWGVGSSRVVVLIGRRPLYEVLDCSSRNETVNLNLYSIVQL